MKYTLLNPRKSTFAKNNSDFVTWMRKNDLQVFANNEEFISAYSHRKFLFEKIELNGENEHDFVEDLQKNNLLKIEKIPGGSILSLFKL
ncbi:hypothetical protein J4771_01685 [Candidatus Kaistella beijingensis]|uniref:hypothetical protein n=1 Tax=Candidatus Kaistella beijingensis TaxID=2820270 RepID=UPI001CC57414|nr:hypothetical protein [Candidatus Kaistella beijingensis]UBB90087.1 hypothetical protein J4771_01685 [Candidatus Kaistella beijingensis]